MKATTVPGSSPSTWTDYGNGRWPIRRNTPTLSIAFEGDAVSDGVQKQELIPLAVIHCFRRAQGDDLPDSSPRPVIICVNLRSAEAVKNEVFQ